MRPTSLAKVERGIDRLLREEHGRALIDFDLLPGPFHAVKSLPEAVELLSLFDTGIQARRAAGHMALLRAIEGNLGIDEQVLASFGVGSDVDDELHFAKLRDGVERSFASLGLDLSNESPQEAILRVEGSISDVVGEVTEAGRRASERLQQLIGQLPGYRLEADSVDSDEYWTFWIDGHANHFRMRFNERRGPISPSRAQMLGVHELAAHALQAAAWRERILAGSVDDSWTCLCIHLGEQPLLEGWAQFAHHVILDQRPEVTALAANERLSRAAESSFLRSVGRGSSLDTAERQILQRVPWLDEASLAALKRDSSDPQRRVYRMAYSMGLEAWHEIFASVPSRLFSTIVQAVYQTPFELTELLALGGLRWPLGPQRERPRPLVTYGSLTYPRVLQALFGRIPATVPAVLRGWRVVELPGRIYPGLIPGTGSDVADVSVIIDLTSDEWDLVDAFEDEVYEVRPIEVAEFNAGPCPLAYVLPEALNAPAAWDRTTFEQSLPSYVEACARFGARWSETRPSGSAESH